jgi:hypothetical protein
MATELLALAAGADSAGRILTATDRRNVEFLDILIENEQKEVIAHTVVQRYLQASDLIDGSFVLLSRSVDKHSKLIILPYWICKTVVHLFVDRFSS